MLKTLALSLIILASFSNLASAKVFNAESFKLDNGLEVVVITNDRAPVVTSMIWYRVGAADEPQGLSGMAHYFEHLMFKGTDKYEPGEMSRLVKKLGGNDNAFTSQDFTAYFQSIAVEHLDTMLEAEADRMVNLKVPPEHFDSEKKVVIEERRQRTENDPKGLFGEQMRSALFVNHPYGTPTIGWMNEIEGYEWEDVKIFYDAWYAPNNATIIISGDITANRVRPSIEKYFGRLEAKELPKRIRPKVPPAIGNTVMTLHHDTIHQEGVNKILIAPTFSTNKKDALALQILQEILSSGPTTRLYKSLVVEQKKAVSVSFYYSGTARDYGTIGISATPIAPVTAKEILQDIESELADLRDNGVTETELKEAQTRLIDSADFARDSLSGPAMVIGRGLTTGSTLDDVENWPENIKQITVGDIKRVANTYLNPTEPWLRPAVIGYLYPENKEEEANNENTH